MVTYFKGFVAWGDQADCISVATSKKRIVGQVKCDDDLYEIALDLLPKTKGRGFKGRWTLDGESGPCSGRLISDGVFSVFIGRWLQEGEEQRFYLEMEPT